MAKTIREIRVINEDRRQRIGKWIDRLHEIRVSVQVDHVARKSLESDYGYTLKHGGIVATGSDLDDAMLNFIERLLQASIGVTPIDPEGEEGLNRQMDTILKELEELENDATSYEYSVGVIKRLFETMAFSNQFAPNQQAQLHRILTAWDKFSRV